MLESRKELVRATDPLLHNFGSSYVNSNMNELRDIFNNAFSGNGSVNFNCSSSINNNNNHSNNGDHIQQNCENGMATNLTETNHGIARQSNLVDEIISLKQRQRPDTLHRNFFLSHTGIGNDNDNGFFVNKPSAMVSDDLIVDLSRRVNNMSVTERQGAQNDLYGFRLRRQREDPLELSIWMNEMEDMIRKGVSGNDRRFSALRLAMHTNGDACNRGTNINPNTVSGAEYVRSQKLKFLRTADWKVSDAVSRMALFFELKLEHFGSECLVRDLTMKDLTPTDLDLWRRYGFLQLAEERDAYGRAIMVLLGKQQYHLPVATVIRCMMYMSTIMTRDESIQLDGNNQLFWGIGQEFAANRRSRLIIQAFKGIPLRGVARHICYDTVGVTEIFEGLAEITQTWGVVRMKFHKGSAIECAYNMLTYGIPRNAIPINNDGEVELEFHRNFLDAIERKESDDLKRRRQERLDRQIQQLQLQNQIPFNGGIGKSWLGPGPYQREPPAEEMELGENNNNINNSIRNNESSSLLPSWNVTGLPGVDPLSLRSEDLEGLPDDFMRRIAEIGSGVTSSTSSKTSYIPVVQKPLQSDIVSTKTSEPAPSVSPTVGGHTSNATVSSIPRKADEFIGVPGVFDVVMGRGRHNKKKPGNRKLNKLLESYQDEYEASDKFQKTVLSEVVVTKMIEDGSRFLVREGEKKNGMWVEVSLEKARDKVAHDFRNLRRNAKMAEKLASDNAAIVCSNDFGGPKRQRSQRSMFDGQNDSKRIDISSL